MTRADRAALNRAEHAARRQADVDARKATRDAERNARIAAWRALLAAPPVPTAEAPIAAAPKRHKCASRVAGGIRAAEKRAEADDAVRVNVSPEMLPAFEVWKRTKADPDFRGSRTEQFEQWAHDHAGDAARMYWGQCEAEALELARTESETDYADRQRNAA